MVDWKRTYRYLFVVFLTNALAASLVAAASETAPHQQSPLVSLESDDVREWRLRDSIRENSRNDERLVVPHLCKVPGERSLQELAVSASVEEAFAYIPGHCVWFEIGKNETRSRVQMDEDFVRRLIEVYGSISLYHIHVGEPQNAAGYFPAYSDLITLVMVSAAVGIDNTERVEHWAMTSLGGIRYEFIMSERTIRLLERMNVTGLGRYAQHNLAYEFRRAHHEKAYIQAVRSCLEFLANRSKKLRQCFPLSVGDFVLSFHSPFDPKTSKPDHNNNASETGHPTQTEKNLSPRRQATDLRLF